MRQDMYAVFVNGSFDSVYESKEEAKKIAFYVRVFEHHPARVKKLTKKDNHMLGIDEE